ncbi:gp53-like domain-containing protein [Enterobacter roggenkampii]
MRPLMPPVQTPDNLFHDGNPLTGELGTIVDAEHLNNEQAAIRDTQSELIAILTAAAMEPESKAGQLLAALNKLYAPLNDTLGALSSLVGGANKLPYFTAANAAALTALSGIGRDIIGKATVADVLTYLGLGTVATKNVGTGSGQIPDMSSFNTGNTNSFRLPTGHFVQIGSGQTISGGFTQSYPTPFPNICQALVGVVYSTLGVRAFIATNTSDRTAANMNVVDQNGNGINVTVGYIAIGR